MSTLTAPAADAPTSGGPRPHPVLGFYGPDTQMWRINREAVLLGAGPTALLLQLAHPLVAAAVAEHSRFGADPVGRLRATLAASYAYVFADAAQAARRVAAVTRRHARVRGALPAAAGRHPAGTPYHALAPDLLLWVYATGIDSWLVAYERFVGPLTPAEREAYYAEARRPGPLWGIPPERFPPDLAALRGWMAAAIAGGEVAVSDQARDLARRVLRPPVWWLPGPVMTPLTLPAVGLLPPALRADFGLAWGPRREALLGWAAARSRALVPHLPAGVRDVPAARAAERRVAPARRGRRAVG
jgi:uncharacterized protein (DUF2236 family)